MTLQTNADASATDWQIAQYYGWGVNGLRQAWTPQDGEIDYAFDPQGNVSSRYTDTRRRTEGGSGWGVARIYDAYGQLRFGDRLEAQSDAVGYNGQSGYYTDVPSLAASGSGVGGEAAQAGLVLCTHRYYSPDLARWLTRDPMGYEGGINVYAYCEDNPVGMIDPLGLDAFDDLTSLMSGWGSGLSFGLTDRIQDCMGTGQYVNRNSGYYAAGTVIGTVHQVLITRRLKLPSGILARLVRYGSLKTIGQMATSKNCVAIAYLVDQLYATGKVGELAASGTLNFWSIEALFGRTLSLVKNFLEIESRMAAAGDGARGIVVVTRGIGEDGHVFNVINRGGQVFFIDATESKKYILTFDQLMAKYGRYVLHFMRTGG